MNVQNELVKLVYRIQLDEKQARLYCNLVSDIALRAYRAGIGDDIFDLSHSIDNVHYMMDLDLRLRGEVKIYALSEQKRKRAEYEALMREAAASLYGSDEPKMEERE